MRSQTETPDEASGLERPTIVKNAASGHFSAVDLEAGEVVTDLGEGRYPHTAIFHPDLPVAYLLYIASAHVEVVDLNRLETIQRVERLGTMPVGSALGPAAEHFFVGTAVDVPEADEPGVIALSIDESGRLSRAGSQPLSRCAGMRIGPDGRLYVAQKYESEVRVLEADPGLAVRDRIPTGAEPHDMYVLDEDDILVVNNAGDAGATFVDLATNEVTCTAETGENPHGFAVADGPDARYGLFPAREADHLAVVDLDAVTDGSDDPTRTLLDLGTSTGFADTTPDGRFAIVDSYDDPFVTIVDLTELSVAERVEIGGEPLHVVFDPEGTACYVGNMARDELAVLDTAPLLAGRPREVTVANRIAGVGAEPSGIFPPEVDS